jgi:hypothetical protein
VLPAEDRRLGADLIVRKSESRVLNPGRNIPGSEHDRFMFDCITYSRPWPIEVQPATVLVTVPAGAASASPCMHLLIRGQHWRLPARPNFPASAVIRNKENT